MKLFDWLKPAKIGKFLRECDDEYRMVHDPYFRASKLHLLKCSCRSTKDIKEMPLPKKPTCKNN